MLLEWRCLCSGGGACAVAVLQPWQCCCSGGAAMWLALAPLQLWRFLCGTSRSERLSASEFHTISYCFR